MAELLTSTNHLGITATIRKRDNGARPFVAQIGDRSVAYKTAAAAFKATFRYTEDQIKAHEEIMQAKTCF